MASESTARAGLWTVGALWLVTFIMLLIGLIVFQTLDGAETPEQAAAAAKVIAWMVGVEALAFCAALGATCFVALWWQQRIRSESRAMVGDIRRMVASQTQVEAILTQVNENILLSEAIKAVAFRDKDLDVLEGAIRQDIRREQWESAELLTAELEKRFGKHRADAIRQEIERSKTSTAQEKVEQAVKSIESLWMIHHYDDAETEVQSLLQRYPDRSEVQALAGRTDVLRQEHKKELLSRWDEALKVNDVEQGVEILKILDGYLSPSEAAALRESARDVFRAKLHQMGVKFSLFVTEKKWSQALQVGRAIIAEYPNTRMAQEVRDKIKVLEENARQE